MSETFRSIPFTLPVNPRETPWRATGLINPGRRAVYLGCNIYDRRIVFISGIFLIRLHRLSVTFNLSGSESAGNMSNFPYDVSRYFPKVICNSFHLSVFLVARNLEISSDFRVAVALSNSTTRVLEFSRVTRLAREFGLPKLLNYRGTEFSGSPMERETQIPTV